MLFRFLWNNKPEKIKLSILIGNKQEGGIEMPDFETYSKCLKIKWIKLLCHNDEAN